MNKRVLINLMILLLLVTAEVLMLNAAAKPDNQPLTFDPVEAVSTLAFVFAYFHVPLPLSIALAVLLLILPAWLVLVLAR